MEKREKLGTEIHFLGRVLGDVIREQAGTTLFDLEEEVRLGARARREGTAGAEQALDGRIRTMGRDQARTVVRAFTLFFDLMNLAEDRERVRVLRERERQRYPEPRSESMEEAVRMMRQAGLGAADIQRLLDLLTIELVFTAHPTEAKRRSVRTKVRFLRQSLVQLDDADLLPRERERVITRIRSLVTGLWQTDLVRPRRPSVLEEVEVGMYFAATLWEVAPGLYADLQRALERIYPGQAFHLPAFLSFGSWIGGDRDGNPFVSAGVTERTFVRMRAAAVDAHLSRCRLLFDELTSSEKQVPVSSELRAAVERRVQEFPEARALLEPLSPHEIYRRFLKTVEWRLERTRVGETLQELPRGAYRSGEELGADLQLMME
ncbi:MAG TPA: phosphoenolpyruvate carboxylase, partial [bacterium]|nr:phosphoenolpyruvate carboxylase [bacterium]